MPTNYDMSYDYQNQVRNVMAEYQALQAKMPSLIQLVRIGAPARAVKEEWPELAIAPSTTTIASFGTDGLGTSITVADASALAVGDILYFESAAGADRQELVRVTAIATNTLTVTRQYGSSPSVTLVVGDTVAVQARPQAEATNPGQDAGREATMNYNYTQIVSRTAKLSRTAAQVGMYGVGDMMNAQVGYQLVDILREQNQALIRGRRVQRSGSLQGTAGGILQFIGSGNLETTGGAVSKTHINNVLKAIYEDGGASNRYALVMAANQAQRISAFNTAGTNPVVMMDPNGTTTGSYVSTFVGDLPVQNGFTANIVVEPNFPKDKIAVLDMNSIEMAYLQPLVDMDATLPGYDGKARRILGEFTFRVLNGATSHGLITGLTV